MYAGEHDARPLLVCYDFMTWMMRVVFLVLSEFNMCVVYTGPL